MYCHKEDCNGELILEDSDPRQEWCHEHYTCNECDATYTREITYKIQSNLVDSDVLVDDETGEVVE